MLAETRECLNDVLLAYLVRLQLLNEKIYKSAWHDELLDAKSSVRAPVAFYIQALRAQLDEIKRSIPSELQQNGVSTS